MKPEEMVALLFKTVVRLRKEIKELKDEHTEQRTS